MNKESYPHFSEQPFAGDPYMMPNICRSLQSCQLLNTRTMSTPMDDSFYPNDMDNYSLQQYTDFSDKPPYGGVDPRLLSSTQNTPILSNEQRLSPFEYTIFNGHAPPSPIFFESDLSPQSYEPMRHQMLGHRRSVSVPPEDLMPESLQPPPAMVFHRGGTPLGDSMGGSKAAGNANKKWLKKAAAAQKRQMQRHSPYHMGGERMQGKRTLAQAIFPQQQQTPALGPTSAPQQMVLTTEDQISQAVMPGFDIASLSSPQFVEFNAVDPGDRKFLVSTELTDIDALTFDARSGAGTAVLGILGFAERISKDCAAMHEFLNRGFKIGEVDEAER